MRPRTFLGLAILSVCATPSLVLPSPAAQAAPERVELDRGLYTAQNGQRFSFVKEQVANKVMVTFRNGDLVLDRAGMRRYEAEHPAPKIDAGLLASAESEPDADLRLLVWLDHQPAVPIAREVRRAYQAELDRLSADVRSLQRTLQPPIVGNRQEEDAWSALGKASAGGLTQADREWLKDRAETIEAVRDRMRREVADAVIAAVADDQAKLDLLVAGIGGRVMRPIPSANAATIVLPAASLARLAEDSQVARIEVLPRATPELDLQRESLGLDEASGFWADGFNGATYDAGVLDTGVQQDHPAFGQLSFESMVGTTDIDGHGTAITGIIASNDANPGLGCRNFGLYCGMAWGMDTLLAGSSDALDVLADADWMVSTATEGPEAINLSAGYGTADDVDYSGFDAFFDALVDGAGVTVCTSAGDGGVGVTTALTHPANAYNVITVANMDDQNTITRFDDVSAASSSRGPTLGGRKKPDLAAPGELTRTTDNDWATGPDFVDVSGTSAAAPHCTGAALLLADQRGDADPLATKATLLNSADTWRDGGTPGDTSDDGPGNGSQWNSTYGWGYLDLEEANLHGLDVFTDTLGDGTGPEPSFRLYRGFLFVGEKVTLTWNRHADRAGANEPSAIEDLTDLDLELYQEPGSNPFSVSGSLLDNVEQDVGIGIGHAIVIAKVKVSGAIDPDVGTERFALATEEGWHRTTLPELGVGAPQRPIAPGRLTRLVVDQAVTGALPPPWQATLDLPPGYTLVEGDNPQTLSQNFAWTVQAPCTTDAATVSFTGTGVGYGEPLSGSSSHTLQPVIDALTPDAFSNERWVDRTFALPVADGRWSAVVMRPDSSDRLDLWGDDDPCMGSPYQTSTSSGSLPEMVVVNGDIYGNAMHQVLVTHELATVDVFPDYTIEYEPARDLLPDGPTVDAVFTDNEEAIEVFQIPVTAGAWYEIQATARPNVGSMDIALFGYEANRDDGDIQNPTYFVDEPGFQNDLFVKLFFQAQATGNFGLVVFNLFDNPGAHGTWRVSVKQGIFVDNFETGDTSNWSATTP